MSAPRSSLLHDQFAETLALSDIAASAGVSADHLGRVFRKHMGWRRAKR